MTIVWFYLRIVSAIAVPIALFEVWLITHYKVGWAELLPQDRWWGKSAVPKVLFNIVGPQLLSRYHLIMYFVIVPALHISASVLFRDHMAHPPATWYAWLIFWAACQMNIMVGEDFLFFVFRALPVSALFVSIKTRVTLTLPVRA